MQVSSMSFVVVTTHTSTACQEGSREWVYHLNYSCLAGFRRIQRRGLESMNWGIRAVGSWLVYR
jgi:hypothetical protein